MPTPDRREFLGTGLALLAAPSVGRAVQPDALPAGVVARFGSPRLRHPEPIHELWFSPGARSLFVQTQSRLWSWETATGRLLRSWPLGSLQFVTGVALDDGRATRLAFDEDLNLFLCTFDIENPTANLLKLGLPLKEYSGTNIVQSASAFAIIEQQQLHLHALPSARAIWTTRLPSPATQGLWFSPDGRWLAVVLRKDVAVFDARTGWRVFTVPYRPGQQVRVSFDAASRRMVVGHLGLTVLDLTSGATRILSRTSGFAPHFTRNGAGVLALADDGQVTEWDTTTGKILRTLPVPALAWQNPCVSGDGSRLASFTAGGTVQLWDLRKGELLPQSADPAGEVSALRIGPTGRLIAAVGPTAAPDEWASWDATGGSRRRLASSDASLRVIALSPDERCFATLPQADGASGFDLRDTTDGKLIRRLTVPRNEESDHGGFNGDGTRFVAAGPSSVFAWDLPSGKRKAVPFDTNAPPHAIAVSADGRLAAVVRDVPNVPQATRLPVVVVDLDRGVIRFHTSTTADAGQIGFCADGSRLGRLEPLEASPEADLAGLRFVVLDSATGTEVAGLTFEADYGLNDPWFAFAPDGRSVVTADGSGTTAVVRELATGGIRMSAPHAGPVTGAVFPADGRRLAVASSEAPIYLWDYRGQSQPAAIPSREKLAALWSDLASRDAARAFQAVVTLTRFPDVSLPFLRSRMQTATPADAAEVHNLIARLDANSHQVREAAMSRLHALADRATGMLRSAQARSQSTEVRNRLGLLLADRRFTAEQLRALRVVEVLEGIGPAARPLLTEWAAGVEGARLTLEAKAALQRLRRD